MKVTKLTAIMIAILILTFGSFAFAQMGGGKMGKQQGGQKGAAMRGAGIAEVLELTDEQIARHEQIRLETKKQMIPLQADLKLARVEMQELMQNGASQDAINTKIDQIGKIKTQMEKLRVSQHIKVRDTLTDEQKTKFNTMPMRGGNRGHGKRGGGMRGEMGNQDRPFGGGGGPNFGDCPFVDDDEG